MLREQQQTPLRFLDDLLANGKSSFTFSEAVERFGRSPQSVSQLLRRLSEQGLIDRVRRGRYAIRPLGVLGTKASSEDVALAVASAFPGEPYRIAYLSALDDHGLLTRPVRPIHVATTKRIFGDRISGRPLKTYVEPEEKIDIGSELVRGAKRSNLERALLESAARPELLGGIDVLVEALASAQSKVDAGRLLGLARELRFHAALRRIGSIVERAQLGAGFGVLAPLKPPTSDLELEPGSGAPTVWRDNKWKVRWAQPPEQLTNQALRT